MRKIALVACALIALAACKERIVVDAPAVLRQTPEGVEKVLGKPDTTYTELTLGGQAVVQHFKMYDVEVQYLDNKASYITVKGPHGLPFSAESLESFGAKAVGEPSTFETNKLIRWTKMEPPVEAVSFAATHFDSLQNVTNFTVIIIGRK